MEQQEYPKISLRAARVNAELTRTEAARRLGMDRETIARYERGDTLPTEATLKRMAALYRFPLECIKMPGKRRAQGDS